MSDVTAAKELSPADRAEHWRRTRNLMIGHLVVWFIFSYGVHMFAYQLYQISFFGWPLNYYLAAQGSLIVFVVQLFLFNRQQHAIDVQFGVEEVSDDIK
jgi:putative solute:sodium symporter small subunit